MRSIHATKEHTVELQNEDIVFKNMFNVKKGIKFYRNKKKYCIVSISKS